jgi:chromosome segregation ATPase
MPDAAYVLLGIVFGVFAGVYLASPHSHRLKRLVEDEKRLAVGAVRSATDQLSTRLEQREHELAQFQNRLDDERKNAELGVSKIKADFARLTDRKEKLEKLTKELESQTSVLKSELQTTTEEGFRELAQFHDVGTSLERVIGSFTQLIETVESRLLAINVRLRKLGIATGDGANAVSSGELEPEATQIEPVDAPRVEYPRVNR